MNAGSDEDSSSCGGRDLDATGKRVCSTDNSPIEAVEAVEPVEPTVSVEAVATSKPGLTGSETNLAKVTLMASIVGSLLSLLLLGVQTFIIFRQTNLIAGQTEAAQFDEVEKLQQTVEELASGAQKLENTRQFFKQLSAPFAGCQDQCRNQRLVDLLPALKKSQFRFDGSDASFARAMVFSPDMPRGMGGSFELYMLWEKMRAILPRVLGSDVMAYIPLAQLADQAGLRCGVDPAILSSFQDNIGQLTPWWWSTYSADPDTAVSLRSVLITSFPQTLAKHGNDALRLSPETATLNDLNVALKRIGDSADASLDEMIQGCRGRMNSDLQRINEIERRQKKWL